MVSCLAHCWVLRQQGGFSAAAFFVVAGPVPVGSGCSGCAGACTVWVCVLGGTGLLFENYIVDASIF